jgi:hypothetical protein
MQRGHEDFKAGRYAAALEKYQSAHAIMHVPTTGVAVAAAEEALARFVDAREHALDVTRMPKSRGESPAFTEARTSAKAIVERVTAKIASLSIRVDGLPDSDVASVEVDGSPVPGEALGARRPIDPGRHTIRASARGYRTVNQDVTLAEGERRDVTLTLGRDAPKAARTEPVPMAPQRPRSAGAPVVAIVGFGAGAAGIAVGSVTGILSLVAADRAHDQCDGDACPPAASDDIDSAKSFGVVSTIAFGVAAVGIAVGVVSLLVRDGARGSSSAFVPAPHSTGAPSVPGWRSSHAARLGGVF